MPNVRRPDRLSISLADKAARAITELTRDNDWLEIRLARLETENREPGIADASRALESGT